MTKLKIIREYSWGVSEDPLDETEFHCPGCGEQKVYVERNEGDYYQGPEYHCIECGFSFTMPYCENDNEGYKIEEV